MIITINNNNYERIYDLLNPLDLKFSKTAPSIRKVSKYTPEI